MDRDTFEEELPEVRPRANAFHVCKDENIILVA